jgi:hypothetical protein
MSDPSNPRDNAIWNLWQMAEKASGQPVEHRRVRLPDGSVAVQLGLPEMGTPEAHYARNGAVTAYAGVLGMSLVDTFHMSHDPTIGWRVYA